MIKNFKKIADSTEIENKIVLEIGPGTGNLTTFTLNKKPKKLIAIEKDNELAELRKKFQNKLTIINEDVLNIDETLLEKENIVVFGNLPYNISTEILNKWIINLKDNFWFQSLVSMFQKEVADRIIVN